MDKRIVFTNPDGSVGVIIPAPNSGLSIDQIAAKDVPAGCPFQIVDVSAIPADREFRNAWKLDGAKKLTVDLAKAVAIKQDKIRAERAPLLADLDVQFMRATETGDTAKQAEIAAKKQALRDATKNPAILNATTVEQLKAAKPAALL